ncbi:MULTISPECIES: hypothetical protein [unclassified Haloferax]|jgi:hypothetical protein|uniref:hypothetical protein n=1 Tax=unclassified Haloferax TaxID=2625095 RepID=UPI002875DF18|nr:MULTISPECIES: hypothetical protein [unclassified Haloferax]MDS0243134.1 hypothetical protein [Haloferax sp. S2CR25]MDS0446255.1 hypothetical protein [Haloferax sp. S2CR25-2]
MSKAQASNNEQTNDQLTLTDDQTWEYDTTGNLPEDIVREFEIPENANLYTLFMDIDELREAMKTPVEEAIDLIETTDGRPPAFEGRVCQDLLDLVHRHLYGVINESRIAIHDDGWLIRVVDSANVMMYHIWIDAGDFEHYTCKRPGVIGVSWKDGVSDALADFRKGTTIDVAVRNELPGSPANPPEVEWTDGFQLLDVSLKTLERSVEKTIEALERRDTTLVFDDGIEASVGLIEPGHVRTTPDLPEIDQTSRVELPGVDLNEICKRADRNAAHLSVEADEANLTFTADGGRTTVSKTYAGVEDLFEYDPDDTNDRLQFEADTNDGDHSIYSGDYFANFWKKVRKTSLRETYTMRFGDELPVTVQRDLGESGTIQVMLAPRIQSD